MNIIWFTFVYVVVVVQYFVLVLSKCVHVLPTPAAPVALFPLYTALSNSDQSVLFKRSSSMSTQ